MRKKLFLLVLTGVLYLVITFIISYFIKSPPFYQGLSIGFPVIYYQFNVSPTDTQYGVIRENIYFNIFIIAALYIVGCLKRNGVLGNNVLINILKKKNDENNK